MSAPRNVFHTSDGHYLAISASMQAMRATLFTVIARADMITDPRFANNAARFENIDELDALMRRSSASAPWPTTFPPSSAPASRRARCTTPLSSFPTRTSRHAKCS